MPAEKHDLNAIFNKAIARESSEERSQFLDAACGNVPEVTRRIEALLHAHSEAGGFFGGRSPVPATDFRAATEQCEGTIGSYKLLEQIGEGGFGFVFMAEQTDPVRRKVAVKVLKPGMDTRQVVVTFGRWPSESWHEAGRLIKERPDATARILLCYEGYAPIDLIRDGQVDLLFDGHSDRPHPDSQSFPPGTLHMRAPTQETIRWVPMTRERISSEIRGADNVPVLNVPRSGPAPLRVNFTAANDGSSSEQTAVIINEYPHRFPRARIRFLMHAGRYRLEGGRTLQTFQSDSRTTTVIDAEADVEALTDVTVSLRPE
jgi:hypothetical protein